MAGRDVFFLDLRSSSSLHFLSRVAFDPGMLFVCKLALKLFSSRRTIKVIGNESRESGRREHDDTRNQVQEEQQHATEN